jgi:hypothetical protein
MYVRRDNVNGYRILGRGPGEHQGAGSQDPQKGEREVAEEKKKSGSRILARRMCLGVSGVGGMWGYGNTDRKGRM